MSTELRFQIDTEGSEDTKRLGEDIGAKLKGGEVILMSSDLGGGKTTMVKGLAQGAGFKGDVISPSFTIANEYKAKKLNIVHFDLYRIEELGIIEEDIIEKLSDPTNVIIIEWFKLASDVLKKQSPVLVEILVTGPDSRSIEISLDKKLEYLMS